MKKLLFIALIISVTLTGCSSGQKKEENIPVSAEEITSDFDETLEEVEHRTGEEIIGVSESNISDIKVQNESSVRNDNTGNWRLSRISENINFYDYALSYYNEYFNDDSEIHAIINFSNSTTIRMSVFPEYALDISIFEYVDKEEHDADLLFSGLLLKQYFVYLDNGDIEVIQ